MTVTRLILTAIAAFLTFAAPLRADVDIREVTSPGGVGAWLVEEHSLPFTALEIRFRGGSALDAPGKRGAINLMTALLEEGAGAHDAQGFATAREALAASFRFNVHNDALSVSARFLSENRDDAVALLRLALTAPRFDQAAIDRVRGQVLANLASRATDPDAILSEGFDALAFPGHPYGSYDGGTRESVDALTRDDIVEAYRRAISREQIYVGAVGDITAPELSALLDSLFEGLPMEGAAAPPDTSFAAPGGVTLIPFDTPQSVAQFGHAGIARDDPDFLTAFVVNQIFGGSGFNSRLMEEVREKRGLTYGIGTYLVPMDHANSVLGSVSSVNANMAEAIALIGEEWRRLAEEGVTREELERAQTYLTGAYPLRFDSNASIARILVAMQMQGLGIDYVKNRNAMVEAITLDEANRVAARIYRPDDLRFVVVGAPEGLASSD